MKYFFLFFAVLIFFFSCSSNDEFTIGLVADFSSGKTTLGAQCRNAVQLAIDDINADGGIFGREVVLLSLDNKNDPAANKAIAEELIGKKIEFIIGPYLSRMTPSLLSELEGEDMLLLSPVVSSDIFAGLDDNLLRLQPNASSDGTILGGAVVRDGNRSVALVRNSANYQYTDWFMNGVRAALSDSGVSVLLDYAFEDGDDLRTLTHALINLEPDAIVFSSRGIDTAAVIQQYASAKPLPRLYSDEWSKMTGILEHGGKTVEGMISVGTYNKHRDKTLDADFKERYRNTFSMEPVHFTSIAYESVMILRHALEEAGRDYTVDDVKEIILANDDYEGLLGPLEFDRFGDTLREKGLYIVKDNAYVPY